MYCLRGFVMQFQMFRESPDRAKIKLLSKNVLYRAISPGFQHFIFNVKIYAVKSK